MYRLGSPRGQKLSHSVLVLLAVCASSGVPPAIAQSTSGTGVTLAMLDLAFYGKHATVLQPTDSLLAQAATAAMRESFLHADGVALTDSAETAAAAAAPRALEVAEGKPCNVIVACARAAGQALGVRWVVMAKVSKISEIIWVLSGQLIDVSTGELVYDDVYELKGMASDVVPKGAQVFARRVAQRITDAHAGS